MQKPIIVNAFYSSNIYHTYIYNHIGKYIEKGHHLQ